MVNKGNHPQMAQQFSLVKYFNLPRYIYIYPTNIVKIGTPKETNRYLFMAGEELRSCLGLSVQGGELRRESRREMSSDVVALRGDEMCVFWLAKQGFTLW